MGMGMVVVTESSVRRGRNVTGNGGRGGQHERAGSRVRRTKRCTLVEDVSEYWGFYEGEGAN